MKNSTIDLVREFHEKFGHPVANKPTLSSFTLRKLRVKLLREEVRELKEALYSDNIVEAFDALLDIQYVLDGAFLTFGLHEIKEEGFNEVHRSNMSKLGLDGKPIFRSDGKILKGPNYSPPDLRQVVQRLYNKG